MEGFPAVYAGACVIITFGPKCGVPGAAAAAELNTARTATVRKAITAMMGTIRRIEPPRAMARRIIRGHSRASRFSHGYLIETGRFSNSKTTNPSGACVSQEVLRSLAVFR